MEEDGCGDRADTPLRKFPDEINVRKTRAIAECDLVMVFDTMLSPYSSEFWYCSTGLESPIWLEAG